MCISSVLRALKLISVMETVSFLCEWKHVRCTTRARVWGVLSLLFFFFLTALEIFGKDPAHHPKSPRLPPPTFESQTGFHPGLASELCFACRKIAGSAVATCRFVRLRHGAHRLGVKSWSWRCHMLWRSHLPCEGPSLSTVAARMEEKGFQLPLLSC